MSKIPKYVEDSIIKYAKYMQKARANEEKIRDWLDNHGVVADGENEWVLDQIIDSIEYGAGDSEHVLATIEEMLLEKEKL